MPSRGFVVGVDFDNTLVSYDRVFRTVALEEGVRLPPQAATKHDVRELVRRGVDGEARWRRLQGLVYGPRIDGAEIVAGVDAFFNLCRRHGVRTYIVSHKTATTPYLEPPIDLREAALSWMTAHRFFGDDGFGLTSDDVFFASSRAEKLGRIRALACTHFIDDLEEVLLDPAFPCTVERLLFAPARRVDPRLPAFESWDDICAHLFGSPQ